jgi:hypothetical protein
MQQNGTQDAWSDSNSVRIWEAFVDEALDDMAPELKDQKQMFLWAALRSMDALTSGTARRWLANRHSFQTETRPAPLGERLRDLELSPQATTVADTIGSTMAYGAVAAGFIFPQSTVSHLQPAINFDPEAGSSDTPTAADRPAGKAKSEPSSAPNHLPIHHIGQLVAAAALVAASMAHGIGRQMQHVPSCSDGSDGEGGGSDASSNAT